MAKKETGPSYEANKKFVEAFGVSETCQAGVLHTLGGMTFNEGDMTEMHNCFRPIKHRVAVELGGVTDYYQLCTPHAREAVGQGAKRVAGKEVFEEVPDDHA